MARGSYTNHGSSPNSRASRAQMPPIAEDETPSRSESPTGQQQQQAAAAAAVRGPRTPLRVPQKIGQSAPPPYVPVTHISPPRCPDEDSSRAGSQSLDGSGSSEDRFEKQHYEHQQQHGEEHVEGGNRVKRWMDRQWFGSRRKRWGVFIALGLLAIGLIVGLAVGLTSGLRNGSNKPEEQNNSPPEPTNPVYPAGSYSFATALQQTSTSCISRSTAWRCYPYENGSNATFFWIITSHNDTADPQSPSYTVSSTDNPFAPSFTNLTASLSSRDTPDEKLTFSFDMDKTVIPSDSLTPDNRAAQCTFGGTKFEATIWTRRKDGREINPGSDGGHNFAAWPADVEVKQTKNSEDGEPRCEDRDGNRITDVQAGDGECVCAYANFEGN